MADPHGEERFTEADLQPSADELRARRAGVVDRVAASVAAVCAGSLLGGLVALGACAAPVVFVMVPPPLSGNAMGTAFARWDRVAMGAAALLLVCELVRTWAARRRSRSLLARVRRIAGIVVALCVAYVGGSLSPRINELHREGAKRGEGESGAELDAVHRRAELVGKIEAVLALGLVAMHVFTIRASERRQDEDDEEDDAPAPLPPGPR